MEGTCFWGGGVLFLDMLYRTSSIHDVFSCDGGDSGFGVVHPSRISSVCKFHSSDVYSLSDYKERSSSRIILREWMSVDWSISSSLHVRHLICLSNLCFCRVSNNFFLTIRRYFFVFVLDSSSVRRCAACWHSVYFANTVRPFSPL